MPFDQDPTEQEFDYDIPMPDLDEDYGEELESLGIGDLPNLFDVTIEDPYDI